MHNSYVTRILRTYCRNIQIAKRRNSQYVSQKIVTVPADLHRHLFDTEAPSTSSDQKLELKLPSLRNPSLQEHFRLIAEEQVAPYRSLLEHISKVDLPKWRPKEWIMRTGWTRYTNDGKVEQVPHPLEDVFVFDVETCVLDGHLPTLAIAGCEAAWYSWCSDRLVNGTPVPEYATQDHLIPLGGSGNRVAIGHNVGYDRVRVRESYDQKKTGLLFVDTMSMHIPMKGMADHQITFHAQMDNEIRPGEGYKDAWMQHVSKNSLSAVHELYGFGELEKGYQNYFVKENMDNIREDFQKLATYCADDTIACWRVYQKMWPEYQMRFPHPVSLVGLLRTGQAYLPINHHWLNFYKQNEEMSHRKKDTVAQAIVKSARELATSLKDADNDPWMSEQTWTIDKNTSLPQWHTKLFHKKTTAKLEWDQIKSDDVVLKSAIVPALFGMIYGPYPLVKKTKFGWGYLVPAKDKDKKKETVSRPGFNRAVHQVIEENKVKYGEMPIIDDEHWACSLGEFDFYRLPHPLGAGGNVGDPLTKSFAKDLETKVLRPTRFEDDFYKLLDSLTATRFWTNYSERYNEELPVWYEDRDANDRRLGALAPAIVPTGTVSRRSVHKLWVTLTNKATEKVIGTGIKSMIQSPPGYRLVGADVDSEEQWIAGLFGDASHAQSLPEDQRSPGITPFSNMMLAGSKNDGTDLHTVVAKQLHINRDHAKTLNYARLYGSGVRHAAKHLMQTGMAEKTAEQIAANLFRITKGSGSKWRELRAEVTPLVIEYKKEHPEAELMVVEGRYYIPTYDSYLRATTRSFENWVLEKIKKNKSLMEAAQVVPKLYHRYEKAHNLFSGGYESATFNFLEMRASKGGKATTVLGCRLVDSLWVSDDTEDKERFESKYKRSVMNWLVQSSAVDFLHLMMVCMEWLCRDNEIDARFVISIHDEVRYQCREEDAPRLALALMLSNMYVRAFISQRVGISQLPMSVAFFSQVDCDTVLRKEVNTKCLNPDGSSVSDGSAWTIEDVLKLTSGSLKKN